jgi:hypothetical protein
MFYHRLIVIHIEQRRFVARHQQSPKGDRPVVTVFHHQRNETSFILFAYMTTKKRGGSADIAIELPETATALHPFIVAP